jgi:hypothetical protein
MICTQCGHENTGKQAFCESCHGFLEWEGKKEPTAAAAPTPAPEPEPVAGPVVEAVQPAVEREGPPPRAAAGPEVSGGLICSACGTGNETTRHFCRQCGEPLGKPTAAAPVAESARPAYPWATVLSIVGIVVGVVLLVIAIVGW